MSSGGTEGELPPRLNCRQGEHTVPWNGTDKFGRAVASGTYFAQMRTDQGIFASEKLMLVR